MKTTKILLAPALLAMGACAAQQTEPTAAASKSLSGAEGVVAALGEEGCPALFDMYAANMRESFPKEKNGAFCDRVVRALGAVSAAEKTGSKDGWDVYALTAERGTWTLKLGWDDEGKITGLAISDPVPAKDACSQIVKSDPTAVDQYLSCRKKDSPAVATWVYQGGSTKWSSATGERVRGSGHAVKANDRWHIGSCGKAMTATLAGVLVQDSVIKWETTICEALSESVTDIHNEYCNVTLEQLLAHQGGLPGQMPSELFDSLRRSWDGGAADERLRVAKSLLSSKPAQAPGSGMVYANSGYIVAALMMELGANRDWETLMESKLFQPLGMTTAGFGPPTGDQPQGHHGTDGSPAGMLDNPAAYGAAGGIHMSLEDWGKFVVEHITAESGKGKLLKTNTAERLHKPFNGSEYALGWGSSTKPWGEGTVLSHMGSNTLWFSYVLAAPKKDFVVLAVTNDGGDTSGKMLRKIGEDAKAVLLK